MNTDIIHRMIRTFVGYGAPVIDDGVGANKADFPFFDRIAHRVYESMNYLRHRKDSTSIGTHNYLTYLQTQDYLMDTKM